jgi:transposase
MLSYYGVALPEGITDKHWSKRYLTFLEQITMERASGDHALKLHLAKLSSVRLLLADVTTTIRRLAEDERYQSSVQYLISVPGVSTLTAMILLTELIDINRFHSLDDLACYCGLVPGEHSTGEEDTITTITSRRNPFLRRVLIESAWVAARKDPALLASFTLLSKRMPKNQAIVRIARKLLNRIRFVLKQQQYYHTSIAA